MNKSITEKDKEKFLLLYGKEIPEEAVFISRIGHYSEETFGKPGSNTIVRYLDSTPLRTPGELSLYTSENYDMLHLKNTSYHIKGLNISGTIYPLEINLLDKDKNIIDSYIDPLVKKLKSFPLVRETSKQEALCLESILLKYVTPFFIIQFLRLFPAEASYFAFIFFPFLALSTLIICTYKVKIFNIYSITNQKVKTNNYSAVMSIDYDYDDLIVSKKPIIKLATPNLFYFDNLEKINDSTLDLEGYRIKDDREIKFKLTKFKNYDIKNISKRLNFLKIFLSFICALSFIQLSFGIINSEELSKIRLYNRVKNLPSNYPDIESLEKDIIPDQYLKLEDAKIYKIEKLTNSQFRHYISLREDNLEDYNNILLFLDSPRKFSLSTPYGIVRSISEEEGIKHIRLTVGSYNQFQNKYHFYLGFLLCALMSFVFAGYFIWKLIEEFLRHKNVSDINGGSLLIFFTHMELAFIVDFFINKKVNLDIQNAYRDTALMIALTKGNFDISKSLINGGANVNIQNNQGKTPLMIALGRKNPYIIEELLEAGADVNLQDSNGDTALMIFDSFTPLDTYKTIIQSKANLDIKNKDGESPLTSAISRNITSISKELINAGANVNIQNNKGETPLMIALSKNNFDIIEDLIKAGADTNIKDSLGNSLISLILDKKNESYINLAKEIIKTGANINSQNNLGETPLMIAIAKDQIDIAQELIKAGADINIKNDNGCNALAYVNSLEGLQELIKAGININLQDDDGDTPLMKYCSINYWNSPYYDEIECIDTDDILEKFELIDKKNNMNFLMISQLIKAGADLNIVNNYGETALMIAHNRENIDIVQELIKVGAKINFNILDTDNSLIWSSVMGRLDLVQSFIASKIDLNKRDKNGDTPLMIALAYEYTDIAIELIKAGANLEIKNQLGLTPIFMTNNLDIIKELIKAGANVDARDNDGYSPLFHSNLEVTKELINAGANVNIQDKDDRTALFIACTSKNHDFIKELINAGANVNIQDKSGCTALQLIIFIMTAKPEEFLPSDYLDVIKELIDAGADINLQDEYGETAFFTACKSKELSSDMLNIIKILIDAGADTTIKNNNLDSWSNFLSISSNTDQIKEIKKMIKNKKKSPKILSILENLK